MSRAELQSLLDDLRSRKDCDDASFQKLSMRYASLLIGEVQHDIVGISCFSELCRLCRYEDFAVSLAEDQTRSSVHDSQSLNSWESETVLYGSLVALMIRVTSEWNRQLLHGMIVRCMAARSVRESNSIEIHSELGLLLPLEVEYLFRHCCAVFRFQREVKLGLTPLAVTLLRSALSHEPSDLIRRLSPLSFDIVSPEIEGQLDEGLQADVARYRKALAFVRANESALFQRAVG